MPPPPEPELIELEDQLEDVEYAEGESQNVPTSNHVSSTQGDFLGNIHYKTHESRPVPFYEIFI